MKTIFAMAVYMQLLLASGASSALDRSMMNGGNDGMFGGGWMGGYGGIWVRILIVAVIALLVALLAKKRNK